MWKTINYGMSLPGRLFGQRWIRFGMVGFLATAVYYALGLLFVNILALPLLLGNLFAYVLSFAVSYIGQSKWTFAVNGRHAAMLPRFAAAQLIGLGINSAIIGICSRLGLIYQFSMLAAIVIVPVFVYFICKFWVFPDAGKTCRKFQS